MNLWPGDASVGLDPWIPGLATTLASALLNPWPGDAPGGLDPWTPGLATPLSGPDTWNRSHILHPWPNGVLEETK